MTSFQPASVVIEAVGKRFGAGPEVLTSVTLTAKSPSRFPRAHCWPQRLR